MRWSVSACWRSGICRRTIWNARSKRSLHQSSTQCSGRGAKVVNKVVSLGPQRRVPYVVLILMAVSSSSVRLIRQAATARLPKVRNLAKICGAVPTPRCMSRQRLGVCQCVRPIGLCRDANTRHTVQRLAKTNTVSRMVDRQRGISQGVVRRERSQSDKPRRARRRHGEIPLAMLRDHPVRVPGSPQPPRGAFNRMSEIAAILLWRL